MCREHCALEVLNFVENVVLENSNSKGKLKRNKSTASEVVDKNGGENAAEDGKAKGKLGDGGG